MTDLRDQLATSLEGTYSVEGELGGGGMARVFVAEEVALSRKVVIKLLAPELAESLSGERFIREIKLAARLQQANIVPVLQAGEIDGLPYYTMPFVAGESLRARLQRGPIPGDETLAILRDVARALAFAHAQGVVHRDIKPENILISGGAAVVTDFGIAKAISASRNDDADSTTLTRTGTSVGTPAYMSPEQAAGDAATDARTDLYAWGVVAYELLAGTHPFSGCTSTTDLVRAHMVETPAGLASTEVPESVNALVMRCLAKAPTERPSSALELIAAIDRSHRTATSEAIPVRRPLGVIGAMVIYAAIFLLVIAFAKVAITAIGLPTWVFGGSIGIMLLGLPVVLLTALVERQRVATSSPIVSNAITNLATWRTTRRGGVAAFGAFALAIGGYMSMRQLGVGPFASLIGAKAIAPRDRMLLADFRGPASDTSLGAVFGDGMRAALDQSKVIRLIAPDQAAAALQRMRSPGAALVGSVAREVAERSGAKVILDGDVKTIGKSYALTVRLLAPRSNESLITLQETARDDADFTAAVGRLAKRLRARIGESLRSVNAAPELAEVTTASLPALRKFTAAERAIFARGDYTTGLQLLREAVEIDTGFAMAYATIGAVYSRFAPGQRQLATEYFQKAYDARDRASPSDRAEIEINYWASGPSVDVRQERAAMSRLAEIDSIDHATRLAGAAMDVGDWTRAVSFSRLAIANDAAGGVAYGVMINAFGALGQMDSVRFYVNRLRERAPRNPVSLVTIVELAPHLGDDSAALAAARELERIPSPIAVEMGKRNGSTVLLRQGKLREARREMEAGLGSERQRGATGTRRALLGYEAFTQATLFGDSARAIALLDSALNVDPWENSAPRDRDYFYYAMTAAAVNRPDLVRRAAQGLRRDDPNQPLPFGGPVLPLIEGQALRAEGKYDEAIASFRRSDVTGMTLFPVALVAATFDQAGQKDSAIVYYEKFVNTSMMGLWLVADARYGQQARRRLGELYEERGEFDKAYDMYSSFVRIWKDADPELRPAVATIRARMNRLESRRAR